MNYNQNNEYNRQQPGYPPGNNQNNNNNNIPNCSYNQNNPNQQSPYQPNPGQPMPQQGYIPNNQMGYQQSPYMSGQQNPSPNPYTPIPAIVHGRPVNLPPMIPPNFGQTPNQQQPPVFTPMGQHHPTAPIGQPQFMPYKPPYANDPNYYSKPFPANTQGYLAPTATAIKKENLAINPQNVDMINKCRKCRMLGKAYEYQGRNTKKFDKYSNLANCLPHTCGRLN